MEYFNFTDEDILKCIKDIDISKSSAIEYLPSHIFKDVILHNPSRFIKIIRLCLDTGEIPDVWKIATVTPLPKGGDSNDVSNLRPISVLPIPGKILERLMHNKLSAHIEENQILTKFQGGYQKGKSTIDSISVLVDDILLNRNKGFFSLAAFIDIKKAFDSVNFTILLAKLKKYGIKNRSLTLIENYLSNRHQCTVANNIRSPRAKLSCGVPQGSILGPLFFLLYMNDCISPRDTHKTMLYADDSVLYITGKSFNTVSNLLTDALKKFLSWATKNKLTINLSKTKIMTFASAKKLATLPRPNIMLGDTHLKHVNSYKYLGVILDQELNFNLHVKSLLKSIRFKNMLLYRARKKMTSEALLKVYVSHALSVIDYADILYTNAGKTELDSLQRQQNRALKTCLGKHILTPTENIHALACLPMLNERRKAHVQIYAYKRSKSDRFTEKHVRNTRQNAAPLLKYMTIHCKSYENSPEVTCAQSWNALKPHVRRTETFIEFKNQVKKSLLDTIPEIGN